MSEWVDSANCHSNFSCLNGFHKRIQNIAAGMKKQTCLMKGLRKEPSFCYPKLHVARTGGHPLDSCFILLLLIHCLAASQHPKPFMQMSPRKSHAMPIPTDLNCRNFLINC